MVDQVAPPALVTPGRRSARRSVSLAATWLAFSGAASLVYQVIWIRQLGLVVGIEVQAVTAGVAAFFAGLAIGGWGWGRLADRSDRPWLLYARLELATALCAIVATWAIAHSAMPFAVIQRQWGLVAWVLPVALVAIPATLMGGTLPVVLRAIAPTRKSIAGAGALLYSTNTAGAIAGTLAAGFVLIPACGVTHTGWVAAALNLAAGAGALWSHITTRGDASTLGQSPDRLRSNLPDRTSSRTVERTRRAAIAIYAIAGGVAMGYEVLWSQIIAPLISTRTFAFSIVLATYLVGLGAGSALMKRHVDRLRDPWGTLGLLITLAGTLALLEVALIGPRLLDTQAAVRAWTLTVTGNLLASMCAGFSVAACWVVLVPTALLGAAFPVALRLGVGEDQTGSDTGRVIAANTAGGIVGMVLTGFVLIPALGLVRSLGALAIVAALAGAVCAFWRVDAGRLMRVGVASTIVACAALTILTPADQLARTLVAVHGGQLVSYDESAGGTVAVIEQGQGSHVFRRLYIQGVSNSGDVLTSQRYMRLQALLPLMIHGGDPRDALVIGAGTGITAGALLTYPGLEHRVVAELLPAVIDSVPAFLGNFDMSHDPRIDIRLRDGRRELLSNDQRYDLITLEPPPPSAAGVVNLYSTDFYALAAARLKSRGIVAQWLPLATQNEAETRSLIKSFIDVFPYASLWTTELHEMLLVGSRQPLTLDVPTLRRRLASRDVSDALDAVGIQSPEALLGLWITDRDGLKRYVQDAPAVTDDDPRIEYAPWVNPDAFQSTLTHLLALRKAPPLDRADRTVDQAVQEEGHLIDTFYHSALAAYAGDRTRWREDMETVMSTDGDNAYYRWFAGMD